MSLETQVSSIPRKCMQKQKQFDERYAQKMLMLKNATLKRKI